MAIYQVMYWKEIPSQVKAFKEGGSNEVTVPLPDRFTQSIDAYAMKLGLYGGEEYLMGWEWGDEQERDGDPDQVAQAVAQELQEKFSLAYFRDLLNSSGADS